MDYPITPAVRFLRERKIEFVPRLYDYVEKGGTRESAKRLGVDEHAVVKTLVFEINERTALIVLMHGDREVSTKNLARFLGVKSIEAATPEKASRMTGYLGRNIAFRNAGLVAGLRREEYFEARKDLHKWRKAWVFDRDRAGGIDRTLAC